MLALRQVMNGVEGDNPLKGIVFEGQIGDIGDDQQTVIPNSLTRLLQGGDGNVGADANLMVQRFAPAPAVLKGQLS